MGVVRKLGRSNSEEILKYSHSKVRNIELGYGLGSFVQATVDCRLNC